MSDDIANEAAASIRKRLILLRDDPQKWLAMIEEEVGYAMAAETAALQAENRILKDDMDEISERMEALRKELACPDCGCADAIDAESQECGCDSPLCERTYDDGTLAEHWLSLRSENERLRERCEDADAAMESLKSLLDPSMPETLLGAVGYMIDHSNTGWMKVGELRKRCEELEQEKSWIIKAVQHHQQPGSPPPGDLHVLVCWVLSTYRERVEELVAELKRSVAIYEQAGENTRIQVDTALASLCEATGVEFEGVTLKQILDKIKQLTAERDALRKKTIDLEGMLSTAHEAGEKLRKERCRKFAVTDGSKQGTCYSFFDHFDVWWQDGTNDLGILDLSDKGIRKTE